MSALEDLAKDCGSLRYARDLIESSGQVLTQPWWPVSGTVKADAQAAKFNAWCEGLARKLVPGSK
jgi:hypothetical protein